MTEPGKLREGDRGGETGREPAGKLGGTAPRKLGGDEPGKLAPKLPSAPYPLAVIPFANPTMPKTATKLGSP